jgi:hypothetical protein
MTNAVIYYAISEQQFITGTSSSIKCFKWVNKAQMMMMMMMTPVFNLAHSSLTLSQLTFVITLPKFHHKVS